MDTEVTPGRPHYPRRWSWRDVLRSIRGGPGYAGPPSDHFDGRRFFNPGAGAGRGLRDFLRWQRTRVSKPWPRWVENRARPRLPVELRADELALTFINHITFLIQLRALNILTDPVYSHRASPFRRWGPPRVRAPGLAFDQLPRIHLVLVSHNHYDHLDIETLLALDSQHAPLFITGLGNRRFLEQFGLRNVRELDWWQEMPVAGATVMMTPAQHWSNRGPGNVNRTLWGGFLVRSPARSLFFAGDSGYGPHFAALREHSAPLDVALLPIGAYEPRWFMCNQHMNPDDAVRAHLDLAARLSIATHFGCFQLTDEAIDDPVRELAVACETHHVGSESFQVLETGETRLYDDQVFSALAAARSNGKR
jgi:L-ascorbate metabolism protein UlaG (beta-lactamase superfamily)